MQSTGDREQRRLLLITLSNVGDLVMTTPLLEALRLSYPDHLIDVVADVRSSELLRPCPYVGRIIHKDKNGGAVGFANLVGTLREHVYDVAVDLRTAFLTLLIRCGQRGVKRSGTSAGRHAVQHHFTAVKGIVGPHVSIPPTKLWLDDGATEFAETRLASLAGKRILSIAPGANWPGKIWPVSHYGELIHALKNEFDGVVVVGAEEDAELGVTLEKMAPIPVVNLAGQTTLLQAAACLAKSAAFVGNDSGPGHVASALSVPTLTVFGPGDPERYRPWGEHAEIMTAPGGDLAALDAASVAKGLIDHIAAQETSSSTS